MATSSNVLRWYLLVALAVALRIATAAFPHSGQGIPPLFGDYEAQRHWMEITTHLPADQWFDERHYLGVANQSHSRTRAGTSTGRRMICNTGAWTTRP